MAFEYPTVRKVLYSDNTSERFSRAEHVARERLEAESTFRTGIILDHGELFLAVPRQLSVAHEQVLRKERRVSALWRQLPRVALGAYIRSLIVDEVVSSNEIEGVYSTRRQIKDALEATVENHAPFTEFAQLYLGITENNISYPETPETIRNIYDAVVGDTLAPECKLGDSLFRRDGVELYGAGGKRIHVGVAPDRIVPRIEEMLRLAHRDDIPEVFCAALCHFLFEYIHPFFDGNGRTGRYLLALQLARPLSQPTVLSLSRTIAENKATYYKAFKTVEHPVNRSEATPFVLMLCDLLLQAQDALIVDLEEKRDQIDRAYDAISEVPSEWDERERDVLFYAAQRSLFDLYQEIRSNDIAAFLGVSQAVARAVLKSLERRGMLKRVSGRPLTYVLSGEGVHLFGLDGVAADRG